MAVGTIISPDLEIRKQQAKRGLMATSAEYQKLHNDLQVRMTNTPSPSLKRMYQKNLQELKLACELLAPGSSS